MQNSRVDKQRASTVPGALVDALRLSTLRPVPSVQHGFTLLEMVLVLFLVGMMASATLMLTEGVEDQAQYDETKRRMEMIRKAIVGDPSRTVNGSPEISGFVADMGRLPGCIAELLEFGDEKLPATDPKTFESPCDDTITITAWNIDATTGLGFGWRGPYIQVLPERDSAIRFRDGYGNSDASDATNSGWIFGLYDVNDNATSDTTVATSIRLQSSGLKAGQEFPIGNLDTIPRLVTENDFSVSLINWDNISVSFRNTGISEIDIDANTLRIKLSYSENGIVNSWPNNTADRNIADYLSPAIPAIAIRIPGTGGINVSASDTVTVPAGTVLNAETLIVAAGDVSFAAGNPVPVISGDMLSVPSGSSLSGTTLTIGVTGKIYFPDITITTGLQAPENLSPKIGTFSLIIACDDPANETAVSGKRYDGDCTQYGTDAAPNNHTPSNQPYIFSISSRNPVQPPPSLLWLIE